MKRDKRYDDDRYIFSWFGYIFTWFVAVGSSTVGIRRYMILLNEHDAGLTILME